MTVRQSALEWDLALQRYHKHAPSTGTSPTVTPSHIPDADPNDRLFLEHFEKRKRMEQLRQDFYAREQFEKNLIFQSYESCPIEPSIFERKLREARDEQGQEHETFGKLMAETVELEKERQALKDVCATRVNADPIGPRGNFDPNLRNALLALGDAKRNDGIVEKLLRTFPLGVLRRFVEDAQRIKTEQQRTMNEFTELLHHQHEIEELMSRDLVQRIQQRMGEEELHLPYEQAIEAALASLLAEGLDEEVRQQRREFLIETNYLGMSMLQAIVQLDIDWLNTLSRLRLAKFHLRGYNPNAVEDLKDSDWYRDLGPSTSLRNASRIRQSSNLILETACNMLRGEPMPTSSLHPPTLADYPGSARYFVV